ncbi:hypothetical protein L345_14816, partial [Ophiophagus hannah]
MCGAPPAKDGALLKKCFSRSAFPNMNSLKRWEAWTLRVASPPITIPPLVSPLNFVALENLSVQKLSGRERERERERAPLLHFSPEGLKANACDLSFAPSRCVYSAPLHGYQLRMPSFLKGEWLQWISPFYDKVFTHKRGLLPVIVKINSQRFPPMIQCLYQGGTLFSKASEVRTRSNGWKLNRGERSNLELRRNFLSWVILCTPGKCVPHFADRVSCWNRVGLEDLQVDGNVCFGDGHKRQNVKRSVIFLQSLPLSSIQNTQEKRGTPDLHARVPASDI